MTQILMQAFWYILPAMVANMMPVWAAKVPALTFLAHPLDGGRTLRGKPLFGVNKTYRGLAAGIIAGAGMGAFLYYLVTTFSALKYFEFEHFTLSTYIALGTLQGIGALLGDAIESMLKRQKNVAPGDAWFPFDQTDYIIGATFFGLFVFIPSLLELVAIFAVGFIFHIATVYIGYKAGIREKPL